MNNGAFGENFPYSNFHDLNTDWLIKIAKDFLDQYTNIQETIQTGLDNLDAKATELEGLLQEWYDTHSEDIADQLASALEALNEWYTEHEGYLDQTLQDNISEFDTHAEQKASETIASIPENYTALSNAVGQIANFQATGEYEKTFAYDNSFFRLLSDTVMFAKNHTYEYYMTGEILNGSACALIINGVTQEGLSDPRTHRFITPEDDIYEIGYYVPTVAVSEQGNITLHVIDTSVIPNSQIDAILGTSGNKIRTNIGVGYTSDQSNTYTTYVKYNTRHIEATLVSGTFYMLYLPITAGKAYRVGIRVNEGNNADIQFIISTTTSSWNGQTFINRVFKNPETDFVDITAEQTTGKTYLLIRMRNGTSANFDIYLADPSKINTVDFNIGEQAVYEAYKSRFSDFAKSIGKGFDADAIFWGDSITAGTGASAYENCYVSKYSELMGFDTVINAGVGGESIYTISARQGGNIVFAPPGNPSNNSFPLIDPLGNYVRPLVGGYLVGNINPYTRTVKLNNTSGNLSRIASDQYQIGINTNLLNDTPIQFPGQNYLGELTIIFGGTNNWNPSKPTQDIDYINMMINNLTNNKYIVMGIYVAYNTEYEQAMFKEYGHRFFNTREMLSKYGLIIENITPTTEDIEAMNNNLVPPSLLSDEIHPNDYGHDAIAKLLYQHSQFLGYTN